MIKTWGWPIPGAARLGADRALKSTCVNGVNEDGREIAATQPAGLVLSNPAALFLNVPSVY